MIKKFAAITAISLSAVLLVILAVAVNLVNTKQEVSAAQAKDFNPGRIIDDFVFYNSSSMNASQVQSFLNSKVPNCDTNGTGMASDWGRPDITRATLASYIRNGTNGYTKNTNFHAPPYTCLKDYKKNTPQMEAASGLCGDISAKTNQTAAQIIQAVANACGINPQVLIILLEKEQSLVTDIWPLQTQFNSATGFDCPDTAPCDPAYAGLFYQVYYAARQFKVYQKYPDSYNYIAGRTNRIYWHPDLTRCGSSQVYIENQATAALYIYTPYRPNQAALNNLYGTGDSCSSYGNRNFWRIFTDWFGNPTYAIRGGIGAKYNDLGGYAGRMGSPLMNERCGLVNGGCYQNFEHGVIYWTKKTDAQALWGGILSRYASIGSEQGFLGYPTSGENVLTDGGVYQQFQNGRIYWKSGVGAWSVHGGILERYMSIGANSSTLGYPTSGENVLTDGGVYQQFQNGRIYWKSGVGAWVLDNTLLDRYDEMNAEQGILGYPSSNTDTLDDGGVYQQFQNGRIYWKSGVGAWSVHGGILERYGKINREKSSVGYPRSSEIAINGGVYQEFEGGRIYWKSGVGAWEINQKILSRYASIGSEQGFLGYPTSGENVLTDGGVYQQFQNGRIYWKSGVGAWSVHGGILERYMSIGANSSTLGYPTSGENVLTDGGVYQQFQNGRIYWKSGVGAWAGV